ncbi:MAG: hypothetical protein ACTSQS_05595 [Promethearchaeota archaeon]
MSEEPQFPPIPDIGEHVLGKSKKEPREYTVVKCENCKKDYSRPFKVGDYVFKEVINEECPFCKKKDDLNIIEIYSEWINPKKEKKK